MADFTLNSKTLETTIDRAVDDFLVYDTSALALRRTRVNNMLNITGSPVGDTDVATLTNKTLTSPAISSPTLSGTIAGTYTIGGTPTFPSSVVTLTGSQTLTNKVLTSPTINTATISNPTITVDTISEFTGANGVTIDGLNIKDSKLNTSNSVVASNITDGIITNAKLSTTAGEVGGAWLTWAPTFVNLSGGTLDYAKYTQIGKTIHYRLKYALAGAGVAGAVTFTPPVTMNANYSTSPAEVLGIAALGDTGTAQYMGWVLWASATTLAIRAESSATNGVAVSISSTVPHTWASTDIIMCAGTYEAS